jgi:ubiquinone/menaquinone biosynthesis C-methylase UbiE
MSVEEAEVVRHLRGVPMMRVLDAGAGTGRYTRILREHGAETVVSLDWSREMLRRHAAGALCVCADARLLPFADRSFDLVNASLMAGDIENLGGWLSEVARVLVPGGRLVYSDFHPDWHERGWKRTFQSGADGTIALLCHAHTRDAHRAGLAAAGLRLNRIDEVSVVGHGNRFGFWRWGRRAVPALLVVSATRGVEAIS